MRLRYAIAGLFALGLVACRGGNGGVPLSTTSFQTLGEVEDAIMAARSSPIEADRVDTDGDAIPDSVEIALGTDPTHRDTDRDGLVDGFELFGHGFDRAAPIPDRDRDGFLASLDVDDDGNFINDGLEVDTDGDGVANYLEYYGYTFDLLTGRFELWNGDASVRHFITDPLQASTDQDAYTDGMEVSGALLDPTVRAPGSDPLVPAYPNLVFELVGYSVTLNETIQLTQSDTLAKGRNWSRQTSQSHSYTTQTSWQIGGKVGYKAGPTGGVEGEVSANFGQSYSSTNTASTSVAAGDSVVSQEGWSRARSTNPTDAARIKLFIKVHNRGTAPLSNIVPTLTLKIGGQNVATFEPGNAQINMLVPGATYPAESGVFWVVDSIDTGNSVTPLGLTMAELRALERGAPASISLTQVLGDVMRLAPGGVWENIGDTNQYVARCDAVCANLRIDLGDSSFVHHLIYAGDTESAPSMTLGSALALVGVDEDGTLMYLDETGAPRFRSLDGFAFSVDPETLRRNGWKLEGDGEPETVAPDGFTLSAMRLYPDTNMLIRAPRDPQVDGGPIIHFAFFDSETGEVRISAADYEGIASVRVVNDAGNTEVELFEDIPGTGFYSAVVGNEDDFSDSDVLSVVVINLAGSAVEQELGRLYEDPEPQEPNIASVSVNLIDGVVYANVGSGNPEAINSTVAWVRVFPANLAEGVLELAPVANFFDDPDGYSAGIPPGFTWEGAEVVAFVTDGVLARRVLTDDDVVAAPTVFRAGQVTLVAETTNVYFPSLEFKTVMLTMDDGLDSRVVQSYAEIAVSLNGLNSDPGNPVDLWIRVENNNSNSKAHVSFNMEVAKLPGADYRSLTKAEAEAAMPASKDTLIVNEGLRVNDVFAVRTTRGHTGKFLVTSITPDYSLFWLRKRWTVRLKFVTWDQ